MRWINAIENMKRIFQTTVLISVLFASQLGYGRVLAAPKNQETIFTFSDLGLVTDLVLRGPYDAGSLRFELPATWSLVEGAELEIVVSSYFTGGDGATSGDGNSLGAALDIYFNDKLQQSISLLSGTDLIYRVPIIARDLPSPYTDGSYRISFFLNAAIDCDFDFHQTTVSIDVNSKVNLPYSEVPLPLDLRRLPWPLYQERSIGLDSALVVIPSNPSAGEIRSALLVMGTFGMMTNGRLPLQLVTVDELTNELRSDSHIILVGRAENLPVLNAIPLQVTLSSDRYVLTDLTDDDGYIEMAISPWNKEKAILVVGGNTDQAVVKAAQALSTGNLQTGNSSAYSIVAEVNPITATGILNADAALLPPPDYPLADLGYGAETVGDIGTNWFSYDIVVPPGQVPSETPRLDLVFSHSALIDITRSDVSVYFNDTLAGSVKLSEEDFNLATAQVKLPVSGMQSGLNNISISATLIPLDDCSITTFSGLWMTIYPESTLHMPLVRSPETTTNFMDLSYYPYPFINDPNLSSTAFVLPSDDRLAWSIAGAMAYELGRNSTGSILDIDAAFDGVLADDLFDRDLILIGQPSRLQIITDLRNSLPAYFEEGSDLAVLDSQQVIYRISTGKNLGYLELFPSPRNPDRIILTILGTSPEGLQMAGNVLLNTRSRDLLNGDFATIDGDKPFVVDTRTGSGIGRIVTEIGESNIVVEQNPGSSDPVNVQITSYTGREYIIFWLIGIVILMALVVVAALVFRRRRV